MSVECQAGCHERFYEVVPIGFGLIVAKACAGGDRAPFELGHSLADNFPLASGETPSRGPPRRWLGHLPPAPHEPADDGRKNYGRA
jgi:hypothetical protein